MNKLSETVMKIEEIFAGILLSVIAILVFWSAIARTIGMPINWAQDISLLVFAWLTFIGGDLICKSDKLINIDMLINIFPKTLQKILAVSFDIAMLVFLLVLAVYGFILVSQSWTRMFNTLPLSYAWCTLAVPVGAILMFLSIIERLISDIKKPITKKPKAEWGYNHA